MNSYLQQFFESEIMDDETYKILHNFISLPNFRNGQYEGNQYIIRKIDVSYIQIEDQVAFENTGKHHIEGFRVEHVAKEMKTFWEAN